MNLAMIVGANLRRLRHQRSMTQSALADKVDVTRETIARYEAGTREPDFEMLMKLANTLDSTVDEIVSTSQTDQPA